MAWHRPGVIMGGARMPQSPSTSPLAGWGPPPPPPPRPAPAGRRWALAGGIALLVLAVVAAGLVLLGVGRASGGTPAAAALAAPAAPGPAVAPGPRAWPGPPGRGGFRRGFGRFGPGFGAGTLTAINPSSLTVRGPFGRTTTVATTASTAYYRDTTKVSRSDLKVGDRVVVNVVDPLASSPTAGAVRIVLPSVVGTVSGVQGDAFTLTEPVGFRHVVHTSSATAYARGGQSSNRSTVLANGAVVLVVGTIDANGSDVTATRVEAFPARRP
jgi:hypothetical protein